VPTMIQFEEDAAARQRYTLQSADQPVLSIRGSVPRAKADRFIAEALHDIRVFMREHDVTPAGPPFSICRSRGSSLDVEAGWPTAVKPPAGSTRIHVGSLPRSLTGPRGAVNSVESRR
jgi:hypothetical protein